jgi:hypothetical protein
MNEPNESQQVPPPPPLPPLPAVPSAPVSPPKSVGAAGTLGIFPGLGHVYLGLYQRGIVFFALWVVIITLTSHHDGDVPIGLLIPFWMVFSIIDAVHQARTINQTGAAVEGFPFRESSTRADGGLTFGIFLILLGAFFLLEKFVDIDLSALVRWWPVLLVALGGWQVFLYLKERAQRAEATRAAALADATDTEK